MQKALTASGRTPPWRESLDGAAAAAAASKLIQQMGKNVDPFRQSCVSVGCSSQKLGVNLLVGFEGYVVFAVIAGLKTKAKQNKRSREQWCPRPSRKRSNNAVTGQPPPSAGKACPMPPAHLRHQFQYSKTNFFFYRYSFYRYLSAYYRVGTAPGSDHNRPKVPASVECALCRGRRSGKTALTECQVTYSTEKTQWSQPRAGALPPPSHRAPRSSAWVGGMDLLSPELESPRAGSTDS